MTEPDLASDHVTLCCPACGASEAADPAVLADAPMIVCRNCGETWPTGPRRNKRLPFAGSQNDTLPGTALIEAERRPLVTFSDGAEKAWAAKIEGDILPEQQVRGSRIPAAAATLAAILFISAVLGGREAAVAALPDLAGLYAAIGLPVNLDGLEIADVEAERAAGENSTRITVRGLIRNVSGIDQAARPLVVSIAGTGLEGEDLRDFNPPEIMIPAGESAPFVLELDNAPPVASQVVVRFRRPSEPPPGGASEQ